MLDFLLVPRMLASLKEWNTHYMIRIVQFSGPSNMTAVILTRKGKLVSKN